STCAPTSCSRCSGSTTRSSLRSGHDNHKRARVDGGVGGYGARRDRGGVPVLCPLPPDFVYRGPSTLSRAASPVPPRCHAARAPRAGGVAINAESELEAVGMAWGALAPGARAATGSTGQGLSLMQESFSEITLAELPLVIFNMARGQQDYFQATRGGGHGDYR